MRNIFKNVGRLNFSVGFTSRLFQCRYQSQSYPTQQLYFNEGQLHEPHNPETSNRFSLDASKMTHHIKCLIQNDRREFKLTEIDNWHEFAKSAVYLPTRAGPMWIGPDDPRCRKLMTRREKAQSKPGQVARKELKKDPVKELEKDTRLRAFTTSICINNPMSVSAGLSEAGIIKETEKNYVARRISYHPRAPIVAVMAHAAHGKTTLLDRLRCTNVVNNEKGGITQSIEAFSVGCESDQIVFLDTPGQESFLAMREVGATLCDLIVLLISAVDGVEKQTKEIIELARTKRVSLIIAVNKIDRNDDISHILQQLQECDVELKMYGGDVSLVKISSKTGTGVDELIEHIKIEAEILQLLTPVPCRTEIFVIESKAIAKNEVLGIVRCGTMRPNMSFVSGLTHGTVCRFYNECGEEITEANASKIVRFTGFPMLPKPGNILLQVSNEEHAKEFHSFMKRVYKAEGGRELHLQKLDLESKNQMYNRKPDNNNIRIFHSIPFSLTCKAESFGKLQAMLYSIYHLPHLHNLQLMVRVTEVGGLRDADISIAGGTNMPGAFMVYGRCRDEYFMSIPSYMHVIRFDVLSQGIQQLKSAMVETLPKLKKLRVLSSAVCIQTAPFDEKKNVANCKVLKGILTAGSPCVQILRSINGEFSVIHEGPFMCLRCLTEEVPYVEQGMECGIVMFGDFVFETGDLVNEIEYFIDSRDVETEFTLAEEIERKMNIEANREANTFFS